MARQRSTVPLYQRHSSGRARVRAYDATGKRVEIILPGEYGSEESKAEYARVLAQLAGGKGALPAASKPNHDCTINELVLAYMDHAESYYVDPVTKEPTSEQPAIKDAVRPLFASSVRCPSRNSIRSAWRPSKRRWRSAQR